ncbi:uncharacterized protein DEA37_0001155 [Paragonimus westermani]|uniref:Uncharacterized protein n=1 Tax=Paragonimus westermani TaxID=34504 RepID=A0A5J4NBE9_9TREM|nr:uncharacterized protein DEA37_0001155 [Paragonimus westermani]
MRNTKKQKQGGLPKPSPIHNHINLLHLQATLLSTVLPDEHNPYRLFLLTLGRNSVRQLLTLCEKSRTRLSPAARRLFCSQCFAVLNTERSASVRFRRKQLIIKCLSCSSENTIPVDSGHWQPCYPELTTATE